jgi:hypothetical protein
MVKYPGYPLPREKHFSIPLGCLKKSLKKEAFKKRLILFKVKEGEDFNHSNTRLVFRGLKSESDAACPPSRACSLRRGGREIGQKGRFSKVSKGRN